MFRYGVVIDGERGNRPNILAQEDLLSHTVSFSLSLLFSSDFTDGLITLGH